MRTDTDLRPALNGRADVPQTSRRDFLRLLVLAATGTLAAACAPITPSAPGPQPAGGGPATPQAVAPAQSAVAGGGGGQTPTAVGAPAAATAEPARGGILRIGQPFDIVISRPHSITFQQYSVIYAIFDTLIRLDPNNKPQPELAESWSFSTDSTQLTLKLKQGVKFHTGRDLTVQDIVWNIERVRDPAANSQNLTMARSITNMATPDPQTLVLTFEAPRPAVFDMLDALWILDPQSLPDVENGLRWVGTGPFKWQSWTPNDRLELRRFDQYWKQGRPFLDGITLQVISDPQALLAQLQANALEMIVNPPFEQVATLRADPNLKILESETGAQMYYVGLNVATPPLDNKDVRHAINYAIDRPRVVSTALSGIGEQTAIPWPPSSIAYDAAKQKAFGFDLNKAKDLLAQAGHADGFDLPFVTSQGLPGLARMAQVIQSDLAKINVRAKIEEVDATDLTSRLTGRKFTHAWNLGFGFNNLHPSTVFSVAFPWRPAINSSNFDSPEYSDLISKLQVTTDLAQSKAVAAQMTDFVLDASFVLPVSPQKRMWATRTSVGGVAWGQEDALFLENAYIAR